MHSRETSRAEQFLAMLTAMLTLAAVAWQMIPEHDRRLALMRTVRGLQRLAARAAAGLGHEGMTDELHGRWSMAHQHYAAALRASQVRDRLGVTLDRLRP